MLPTLTGRRRWLGQRLRLVELTGEVADRLPQALLQPDYRAPAEEALSQLDRRSAPLRVVLLRWQEPDGRPGAGKLSDLLGNGEHGDLLRVAEIDRPGDRRLARHELHEASDQVVDIAEGARLPAAAEDGQGLAAQRLGDQGRDDPTVRHPHARPIGVEDAGHLDGQAVTPAEVEEQGLGRPLALVVAGAGADRVDMAAIGFLLRVLQGIAIDLAGRGLEDPGTGALGPFQHVQST